VLQRIPTILLLTLIFTSPLAFAQARNQRQPPIRPIEGAKIFQNYCASCHGADARGNGPVSPTLRREVPDLTRLSQRNKGLFPADRVRTIVMFGAPQLITAHGSKAMPIWGPVFHEIEFDQDLGNVRLDNITRYLESIQQKK
jgi:mono/diheme cytochrome c family protein